MTAMMQRDRHHGRGRLRRRDHPHRLPDPLPRGLRQAAGLSRQRRLGAEAARPCSTPSTTPTRSNTPTSIAACTTSPTPPPPATRRRARPCAASSMRQASRRSSSRATRPRRINLVASSLGMDFGKGDEIVLSIMEHHSNIVPWHFHRERKGAVLKWAPIADDGTFLLDEFEKLLTKRTKIVAITHMSNVLGTVVPIKEVVRSRTRAASRCWSTAARPPCTCRSTCRTSTATSTSSPATRPTGRPASACSTPRSKHLDAMPPYHGRRRDDRERAPGRHHLRRAAAQVRGRHAADRAGDRPRRRARLHDADRPRPHRRATRPSCRTTRTPASRELNWLKIHGTAKDKGAIVSFSIDGLHPHDISTIIDRSGVAVRAGHHCAQPLMERLGVTATCRASFAMYNTKAEVDALAEALIKAHDFFG